MPTNMIDGSGRHLPNTKYKAIAASQTTSQLSNSGNSVPDNDFLSHVTCIPASTAAAGFTVNDGTTAVLVVPTVAGTGTGTQVPLPYVVELGITATSTKGFNITTAAANSVVAVGRW